MLEGERLCLLQGEMVVVHKVFGVSISNIGIDESNEWMKVLQIDIMHILVNLSVNCTVSLVREFPATSALFNSPPFVWCMRVGRGLNISM